MAKSSDDMDTSFQESPSSVGCAGLCCPHSVLEISHDASVEEARAAAEGFVMQLSGRGGSEWILNMKLAAFAAIVTTKLGEDRAWDLYQEVRPKNPPFNVFVDRREERGRHGPPPPQAGAHPPEGDIQEERAPLPGSQAGPSSNGVWGPTTNSSVDGDGWSIVPVQHKGTSQEPEEIYWWQVKKGPAGKRKWGWMDDNVSKRLEEAFRAGDAETTVDIDGWLYSYDFIAKTQTSPGEAATARAIRRVICDGNSDEGWSVREAVM